MNRRDLLLGKPVPAHVAIIMDGNGRWAIQKGKPREVGHASGVKSVRAVCEAASECGVKHLTLFAFSTENWNRSSLEVSVLLDLLVETINNEISTLIKNNICFNAFGDLDRLPEKCRQKLAEASLLTHDMTGLNLNLAISYSSRTELMNALIEVLKDYQGNRISIDTLNEDFFRSKFWSFKIPDPDLLIRTSGEKRLSNFLLWQMAYTELYFTSTLWPDFRKNDFYKAIYDFQKRDRRFGLTK